MKENNLADKKMYLNIAKNQYIMALSALNTTLKEWRSRVDENGDRLYSDEEIDGMDRIILLRQSVEDNRNTYYSLGGKDEDLNTKKKKREILDKVDKNVFELAQDFLNEKKESTEHEDTSKVNIFQSEVSSNSTPYIPTEENTMSSFDVIPLPSNGECYKSKISTLPVGYLTAYDENVIINPNLYGLNLVIDTLLKLKVLDKTIDPNDLLEGDRDAIILFLRTTGYGNEYPLRVTDNETGTEFKTVIDLSKLHYKPFTLKGDENGWFDFTLPVTKKEVKFRFLTHRDNLALNKIEMNENPRLKKERLEEIINALSFMVDKEENVDKELKINLKQSVNNLKKWLDGMDDIDGKAYTNRVSNELEYSIMSINGNTDRNDIHEFVKNMPIKDSTELRLYINKNIPGIDYEMEIERPKSLGGGSMKVFPQFDQFIFLNRTK